MIDINNALKDTNDMYKYIAEVANDIMSKYSGALDDIVDKLSKNIDTCSNQELRSYLAKVSIEAYNLSISKEQTALKEACATALYKEGLATEFNGTQGAIEVRKNSAISKTMEKQAVSLLYASVSSLFKTKVDEAHRIAGMISNIMISRAAESKLQFNPRSQDFNIVEPDEFN